MSDQTRDTRQFFAYLETAKKWAVTPPEKWERGKLLTVHGIQSKPEINGQIVEIFNSGSLDAEGVLRFKCALCEPLEGGSFTRNSYLQLKASCLSCIPLPTDPELLTELTDIMLHLQLVTDFADDEEEHQHDHEQLVTEAQQKVTRALTIWPAAGGMWMYRAHSLYHRPHLDLRKVDLLWRALGNGFSDVPAGNLAIHSQLADELEKDGAKTFALRCDLFEALKLRYQHDGSDTWEVALAIQMLKGSEQGCGRRAEEREATIEAVLDKLEHLKRKGTATGLKSSVGRNEVDLVRRTIPAALSRFWFLAMEAQARGRRETLHSPSALVHFREAERLLVLGTEKWGDADPATADALFNVRARMSSEFEVHDLPVNVLNPRGGYAIVPKTEAAKALVAEKQSTTMPRPPEAQYRQPQGCPQPTASGVLFATEQCVLNLETGVISPSQSR